MKAIRLPLVALMLLLGLAAAAPWLPLLDPVRMDVAHRLAGASAAHPLGQDEFGRDELARLIWGARTSLLVALSATAIAGVVGTLLGLVGGFVRGIAELLAVRSMDVVLCFPPLLLAILVVTLAGPGAGTLIAVLSVLFLPGFTRVAYAGVLTTRQLDYVEALRVLGANPIRVMLRTVLPNIAGPLLVQASLAAASAVVLETGLSFLGLGVVPPTPSWGLMVRAARQTVAQSPALLLWPCLALVATIFILNVLCDRLQASLDPHGATRSLWRRRARPLPPAPGPAAAGGALSVEGLTLELDTPAGPVPVVRDVSLAVPAGRTLALVGESGSGKSLTGLAVMGLLPPVVRPIAGSALLAGEDLLRLDEAALRRRRGAALAMVFQDPASSLNPVHRIGDQIDEVVRAHGGRRSATELLAAVAIPEPARRARAFPHQLSGGMRQRVMIAMAIANGPRLLIADEPTTALDVTVQAQVIALLAGLQREGGMGLLFITHNLPLVAEIADRVAVMYGGEIVEQAEAADLFAAPLHPYTQALLRSTITADGAAPEGIAGSVPTPGALPPGCVFAPRCALRLPACEAAHPALREVAPDRLSRCIRWAEMA